MYGVAMWKKMPHSVAPKNAAVCNKSKADFRLPTVRKEHKEELSVFVSYPVVKSTHSLRTENPFLRDLCVLREKFSGYLFNLKHYGATVTAGDRLSIGEGGSSLSACKRFNGGFSKTFAFRLFAHNCYFLHETGAVYK